MCERYTHKQARDRDMHIEIERYTHTQRKKERKKRMRKKKAKEMNCRRERISFYLIIMICTKEDWNKCEPDDAS